MLGNHSLEFLDTTQCDHVVSLKELEQEESHGGNDVPSFSGEYIVEWDAGMDMEMEVEVEVEVEANGRLRRKNPTRLTRVLAGRDKVPMPPVRGLPTKQYCT